MVLPIVSPARIQPTNAATSGHETAAPERSLSRSTDDGCESKTDADQNSDGCGYIWHIVDAAPRRRIMLHSVARPLLGVRVPRIVAASIQRNETRAARPGGNAIRS
jgi:hypothetical protein